MELRTEQGVVFAIVDASEAVDASWKRHRERVDVVRVVAPPRGDWPQLRQAGFVAKPDWVTWVAPTAASEDEFLERLSKNDKQNIRTAAHRAQAEGLRIHLEQPLRPSSLNAFLGLYEAMVQQMEHGVAVASEQRQEMLDEGEHYFALYVFDGDTMVGGCLCLECPGEESVRIRFSAVDPDRRRSGFTRVVYLDAIRIARDKGYPLVILGGEPNLFGHIVKPGLFSFKARLGFAPVSSQVLPGHGQDEADNIRLLGTLSDPTLLLGYEDVPAPPREELALRVHAFSQDPGLDLRPYRSRFLAGTRLHPCPRRASRE